MHNFGKGEKKLREWEYLKGLPAFDRMEKSLLAHFREEISFGLREIRYSLTFLTKADMGALFFSMLMMASIFFPWISKSGIIVIIGAWCGGTLHFLLALLTCREVYELVSFERRGYQREIGLELPCLRKRVGLGYSIYGFSSTISGIINLFYFSSLQDLLGFFDIGAGFYLCLLSGIGIIACGLERFRS